MGVLLVVVWLLELVLMVSKRNGGGCLLIDFLKY